MAITGGTLLNVQPAPIQQALVSNYLDLADASNAGWGQQYVPDLMTKEAEIYGNRTISGFLAQVGAEESMSADQVVWSEQGRLHLSYKGDVNDEDHASGGIIEIEDDIDGNDIGTNHAIRVGDLLLISHSGIGVTIKCVVTAIDRTTPSALVTVAVYGWGNLAAAGFTEAATSSGQLTILVYGSEFAKGDSYDGADTRGSNQPSFKTFTNKPIIMKDNYVVSGSDASKIGWVEISSEDGTSGYLWYLKAESETRLRFEDYLEMMCVEGELVDAAVSPIANLKGTQGLFAAIEDRGNVQVGFAAATGIQDFDDILRNLDTQGAIEENMLFLDRQTALDFDDMLAAISSGSSGGTAYGLFENSEEMALNLGFSGFRRGSYDFYKTDWKYLNDASTRGAMVGPNSIEGVLIPAGTTTVYDQILGTNIRRPFLHVRYRASQTDDRRMKSWLTGSVGGAFTSDLDAMEVNFLSERCLVTQAANNFVLFKGV